MDGAGIGAFVAQKRAEYGLSQARLAELLADVTGNPAITRHEVSRWERGQRRPRRYWLDALARVLGVTVADLEDAARLTGPITDDEAEALDLAQRVAATDVGGTLDRIEAAVDDHAVAYPGTPPDVLLPQIRRHLRYVGRLLDGRMTLAQHRRLVVAGGWLSLLAATCSIDLHHRPAAAARLRTAADLADHAGHGEIAAWCVETEAWQAVADGDHRRAVTLSQGAQQLAPAGSSALIQATAQEGRALARLGDTTGTLDALARTARLVAPLPVPDRPEHHYRYDPSKADAYVGTTLAWLGDPAAERYARQVLARLESTEDGPPRPRRAASARLDLALALVASGKPDEAAHVALAAVTSGRLVPSNYWRAGEVIRAVDGLGVPDAADLRDAFRSLGPTE
jgi:transcriptional regulator with XRE-family HTH domain